MRCAVILRNIAFALAFYAGTVVLVLASLAAIPFGNAAFRRCVEGWSAWHFWCARRLLGITLRIEGELPAGSYLVAMRHESFFEAIDLPRLLDHPVVFAKAELLRLPLWGKVAGRYGLIAVERDQGARALRHMLAEARALMAPGRPAAIFPEGRRIAHGTAAPLQAGFAALYKLLALPVLPIAVNSGPLYHRRWKRSGTITYRIGTMIEPGLPRAELEAQVSAAINALNPVSGSSDQPW